MKLTRSRAQSRHQSSGGEKRDRGLAKVHGRQVTHNGFADKNGRPGKRYVYFFKPANDRNRGKHKGNARAAPHST
jgi:hypothetical protein